MKISEFVHSTSFEKYRFLHDDTAVIVTTGTKEFWNGTV